VKQAPGITALRPKDAWAASLLVALTLVITTYFAPRGFQSGFVDLGHDGYQLRQALDLSSGGVIFRDTFDQYGPLNGYLNTIGFVALGRRLLAMKYFMGLWYAASVAVLFVMARLWLDLGLATFSVLVWLGLAPFYQHGIMISPHVYMLLFQAAATLMALRTPDLAPRRFLLIGLLTGLCWAVKQSTGVLFLAAILTWLLVRLLIRCEPRRCVVMAIVATSAGFVAVFASSMALLWMYGAVQDWYLQTILFPKQFYMSGGTSYTLLTPLVSFAQEQLTQPAYWMVIRAVVLAAGAVQLVRRETDDLLLVASVTAFLWFAAYPSGNYMHQWWTTSLSIAPFLVCIHRLLNRWLNRDRAAWAAVAAMSIVVAPGLRERAYASAERPRRLTEVLAEPPVLRGIQTDPRTKRAVDTMYHALTAYRADHPQVKVVSIDAADGWVGVAESLPLLSFLDDNAHPFPVYWNMPVLSTVVYPGYPAALWRGVEGERPLIVDHQYGEKFHPMHICQYGVLAAARSEHGYWYLYAPAQAGIVALPAGPLEGEDDWLACAEDGSAGPPKPRVKVAGAWRGAAAAAAIVNQPIRLTEPSKLELFDPWLADNGRPVNVYTWPATVRYVRVDAPIQPMTVETTWRGGKDDIVRSLSPGEWIVDGYTKQRLGYLLQWDEQHIAAGERFVARGDLLEGGLEIGLMRDRAWIASVCVSRPGPFETVLQVQTAGRYALVLANCIEPGGEPSSLRSFLQFFGLRSQEGFVNRFRVSRAGWISPDVTSAGMRHRSEGGVAEPDTNSATRVDSSRRTPRSQVR